MSETKMYGYKAFYNDLTCRGMQYEIGKKYEIKGKPIICKKGFHFCKSISSCYNYYPMETDTRICKVIAYGEIVSDEDGEKFCTNKIEICEEIENPKKASNVDETSDGFCNSGACNTGDWNSGYNNLGNKNSGGMNLGDRNSGDKNCGDHNSGDRNHGNYNTGDKNSGKFNSGWANLGNNNSGDLNLGNNNSGDKNSGKYNSGSRNSGSFNSGDRNSGNCNSGFWNSGNYSSGIFNTRVEKTIDIFDLPSGWTMDDWYRSHAKEVMDSCPYDHIEFIDGKDMDVYEKCMHPEWITVGGYLKTTIVTNEERQSWWDELPDHKKQYVYDLPNFNAEKFLKCTGIDVNAKNKEKKRNKKS